MNKLNATAVTAAAFTGASSVSGLKNAVFRLDALALSVIATATWLGGCHTPVLYQNR